MLLIPDKNHLDCLLNTQTIEARKESVVLTVISGHCCFRQVWEAVCLLFPK